MRFVSLMSGGIDSPTATHLILKRGNEAFILNMDNDPFLGPEESKKVERLARKLAEIHPGKVMLFRAKHGINLSAFKAHSNLKYTCILCKRAMLRVADILCDRVDAEIIVMGDSMSQVASQTLYNMAAVSRGNRHPIVRPLIGMDKLDIEHISREEALFFISIGKTEGGCLAVPRFPIIAADLARHEEEAEKADLENVVKTVAGTIREVKIDQ
jgi:thiamine biosynthesis protein ThiI